ncbi:MAG: bifunctional UDP-sugar hydrolase/5'-nucleotidase [Candidatus Aureabacteria bacterium]|nr:bifunctional UDP-sugar hydrolase/5'-nucleotidase [Candidatus Auribacterota bacterium]
MKIAGWIVGLFLLGASALFGGEPVPVTILYTSANKGYFLPYRPYDAALFKDLTLKPGDRYGGYAAVAYYIKKVKKEVEEKKGVFLLVDGGNSLVGSSEADFFQGQVAVDFMNRMGYNSVNVSNLDWSLGKEVIEEMSKKAAFAFLACNVFSEKTDEPPPYLKPYTVVESRGLEIGIIGYAQDEFSRWFDPTRVKGLYGLPPAPIVQKHIDFLRKAGTDLIIVVDHSGDNSYWDKARALKGMDVMIEGAAEWATVAIKPVALNQPKQVGEAWVFPDADSHFAVGRADLLFDQEKKKVVSARGEHYFMDLNQVEEDPEIKKFVTKYADTYFEVVGKKLQEVIGYAADDFTTKWDEKWNTSLSTLVCEALRRYAQTDVGLMNLGSIRRHLRKGPIRLKDVQDVLPFQNTLVTFAVKGKDLYDFDLLSNQSAAQPPVPWIYVAGAGIERAQNLQIKNIRIGGKEIDPEREYTFATNVYLYHSGHLPRGICREIKLREEKITDVVAGYIREHSPISPGGREVGTTIEHAN